MTPDVNVLVAASRSDHPHHAVAITWLESALASCLQGERLRLLPMVTAGFLRLVTHPKVFVEWISLGEEWSLLETLCRQHQLTGNAISDGWIAAAVLARQEKLVTLDRDFLALLPPRQLTLLSP